MAKLCPLMDQEELELILDSNWKAFRSNLISSLLLRQVPVYENEVAAKLDNNNSFSFLLATESTDMCKESPPLLETPRLSEREPVNSPSQMASAACAPVTEVVSVIEEVSHTHSSDSEAVGVPKYKMGPSFLESRIADLSPEQQRAVRRKLRLRLGVISSKKLVSGKSLHDAVCALGLTRYDLAEINELVNNLAMFIGLSFSNAPSKSIITEDLVREDFNRFGMPTWQWPKFRESISQMQHFSEKKSKRTYQVVPAAPLMELLLAVDSDVHRRIFGASLPIFQAIREVLLAGDTNRLVAELTFVRLNDLAAPPEPVHPLLLVEPLVALLIVANAVMMGFQTDPRYENWEGWIYFEVTFASLLILEILCRIHIQGCRKFWCGLEAIWNCFDVFLAAAGWTDILTQVLLRDTPQIFGAQSVLRLCRLVRLVRIIKAFRLKFMGELRLMVKGWIAGLWTLSLAFTLLFTVIYVISGFATMTIGSSPQIVDLGLEPYFRTLPDSMFTAFRCFTGECVSDKGYPIHSLLASEFGHVFVFGYVVSYMLVSMGIFNVILGVYVEITMKAAKETEAQTSEQHSRESIRIARVTRELLKKFAAAYRAFQDQDEAVNVTRLDFATDDEFPDDIAITKELFLLVIQEPGVQALLDDLDLPTDRANMFEVIDADGSGSLEIAELVHGLLKLRGEVNKSDTVAALLATKCLQSMITEMKDELLQNVGQIRKDFQAERAISSTRTSRLRLSHLRSPCVEDPSIFSRPMTPHLAQLGLPRKPEVLEEVDDMVPDFP